MIKMPIQKIFNKCTSRFFLLENLKKNDEQIINPRILGWQYLYRVANGSGANVKAYCSAVESPLTIIRFEMSCIIHSFEVGINQIKHKYCSFLNELPSFLLI